MVSLLVVYQEALHALTVMLTSGIIARAPTMRMNERNVVSGIASPLVASREVLHAATVLIFEIIARALTRGMIKRSVVYGTLSLLVAFQQVLRAVVIFEVRAQTPTVERMIVSA